MKLYVLVPAHVGIAVTAPAATVNGLPQLSVTVGGVGTVFVLAGHATVEDPFAGITTAIAVTVTVIVVVVAH